ncbi:type II secretion system protein [Halorarum halobium]|uniref:type II secretion system protein n=1 Tax=Halorarum halobium TaxID=3075121 RepID=UPI0028A78BB7|nr:type II secretion system protein [Halobaculum sp. XH14]
MLSELAGLWPISVRPGREFRQSLGLLGVDRDAEQVLEAGYVLSTGAGLGVAGAATLIGGVLPAVLLGAACGLGLVSAVPRLPRVLATFRRTRALGDAVELVGLLALQLRLTPVPERAARFTARTGDGLLARSLRDWVGRSVGTPRTGLQGFGREWEPWFPALARAVSNLEAAAEADPDRRDRVLDRAVDTVDRALSERVQAFANELHGPVTGLYAFGVLLPLALVGTLPAATAAGIPITPAVFVLGYDVLLPGSVAVAGVKLLAARPVAFPPPTVSPSGAKRRRRIVLGVAAGFGGVGVGWVVGTTLVGGWAGHIAAVGAGSGAVLVVVSRPIVRERRRVRELERGLSDALSVVGRAVSEGTAVENAVERAGAITSGPVSEAFEGAARRRELLGVRLGRAFLGTHGPMATRGGTRSRGAVALLVAAAREGRPAGDALRTYADRLDELLEHERTGRRALATVTRTLSHTAALFGPLVGGATVALARRLAEADARLTAGQAGTMLPPDLVGTAVGWYVLLLAVILTSLATGLERGLDGWLVAYRTGIALLTAVGSFLAGVVGAGLLL